MTNNDDFPADLNVAVAEAKAARAQLSMKAQTRRVQSVHFVAFGPTPMAIALADDGTLWFALVCIDQDGMTFRRPSPLMGKNATIGELPPGWTECGAGVLPQGPLSDFAFEPPVMARTTLAGVDPAGRA